MRPRQRLVTRSRVVTSSMRRGWLPPVRWRPTRAVGSRRCVGGSTGSTSLGFSSVIRRSRSRGVGAGSFGSSGPSRALGGQWPSGVPLMSRWRTAARRSSRGWRRCGRACVATGWSECAKMLERALDLAPEWGSWRSTASLMLGISFVLSGERGSGRRGLRRHRREWRRRRGWMPTSRSLWLSARCWRARAANGRGAESVRGGGATCRGHGRAGSLHDERDHLRSAWQGSLAATRSRIGAGGVRLVPIACDHC